MPYPIRIPIYEATACPRKSLGVTPSRATTRPSCRARSDRAFHPALTRLVRPPHLELRIHRLYYLLRVSPVSTIVNIHPCPNPADLTKSEPRNNIIILNPSCSLHTLSLLPLQHLTGTATTRPYDHRLWVRAARTSPCPHGQWARHHARPQQQQRARHRNPSGQTRIVIHSISSRRPCNSLPSTPPHPNNKPQETPTPTSSAPSPPHRHYSTRNIPQPHLSPRHLPHPLLLPPRASQRATHHRSPIRSGIPPTRWCAPSRGRCSSTESRVTATRAGSRRAASRL